MILFGTADDALRRRLLALGLAALTIVTCRTPPPLPNTPPPAGAVATAQPAADPRSAAPSPPAPVATAAIEKAPARDFSVEQRALAERYEKHRALSTLRGEASYYGKAFAGRKTASGEIFEPERYTAAHRSLPFGTVLRVTRLGKHGVVYVRVNDRGPFGKKRRIIDLSEAAASELDMLRDGICEVRVEVLERGKP
jgi:rare lipoprotein A (peptidoglycan hydrolase)